MESGAQAVHPAPSPDPQWEENPGIPCQNNSPNSTNSPEDNSVILLEDVLPCLSHRKEPYRLILTSTKLLLSSTKDPRKSYEYLLFEDLFGIQTLRHKKQTGAGTGAPSSPGEGPYSAAYICFYLYPRIKKKRPFTSNSSKVRERMTLVFEMKKPKATYESNLDLATKWKNKAIHLLAKKFPKWQTDLSNLNNSWDRMDMDNNMDPFQVSGQGVVPLVNYIPYLRRYLVILNPKSGQGKTTEIFQEKVAPIFREGNIKMELLITQHPGHARNMVSEADLSEIDGIISIGGDGILYEVVNGLRTRKDSARVSHLPIGVIAGGSGNGLARSLANYSGDDDDYLAHPVLNTALAATRGRIVKVNLAEIDLDGKKVFSFLSVGCGLLADIDVESEFLRALGESRFTIWSFYRLIKLRSYGAKLSFIPADNPDSNNTNTPVIIDSDFITIYSAFQSYIGSDLVFAPEAKKHDGLIHLVYIPGNAGRSKATQFLISIDKGSHLDVRGVEYVKVKEFTIEREGGIGGNPTIDGELVAGQKLNVKICPIPLNVFSL